MGLVLEACISGVQGGGLLAEARVGGTWGQQVHAIGEAKVAAGTAGGWAEEE